MAVTINDLRKRYGNGDYKDIGSGYIESSGYFYDKDGNAYSKSDYKTLEDALNGKATFTYTRTKGAFNSASELNKAMADIQKDGRQAYSKNGHIYADSKFTQKYTYTPGYGWQTTASLADAKAKKAAKDTKAPAGDVTPKVPATPNSKSYTSTGSWKIGNEIYTNAIKAQQALVDAGYDLGQFGENKNGVDGKWGDSSKKAYALYEADQANFNNEYQQAVDKINGYSSQIADQLKIIEDLAELARTNGLQRYNVNLNSAGNLVGEDAGYLKWLDDMQSANYGKVGSRSWGRGLSKAMKNSNSEYYQRFLKENGLEGSSRVDVARALRAKQLGANWRNGKHYQAAQGIVNTGGTWDPVKRTYTKLDFKDPNNILEGVGAEVDALNNIYSIHDQIDSALLPWKDRGSETNFNLLHSGYTGTELTNLPKDPRSVNTYNSNQYPVNYNAASSTYMPSFYSPFNFLDFTAGLFQNNPTLFSLMRQQYYNTLK